MQKRQDKLELSSISACVDKLFRIGKALVESEEHPFLESIVMYRLTPESKVPLSQPARPSNSEFQLTLPPTPGPFPREHSLGPSRALLESS